MKEKYNIREVSDIFKVPKSTLRYWDAENLIRIERNQINEYREYTLQQLIEISDIAFYRSINVPIAKLRKRHEMNINDFEDILNETQKDIDVQIRQLKEKKKRIIARKDMIRELEMLHTEPYTNSNPNMNRIINFDISHFCEQNPNNFAILISPDDNYSLQYGTVISGTSQSNNLIWESSKDKNKFIQCLLKVSVDHEEQNNLKEHFSYIEKSGYKVGKIVGRYLITATEDIRYDYYKVWIEIFE